MIYYRVDYSLDNTNWAEISTYTPGMSINTALTHTPGYIFPSAGTIYYRVVPKNGVGYGSPSTVTPVQSDSVPTFMNAPTNTSVTYNSIDMSWTIITDDTDIGRDPIIYYTMEWFSRPCYTDSAITCTTTYVEPDDGTWTEITSFSDVSNRLATSKIHSTST